MRALLGLEREFGRERGIANAPRTLDLDLIAYGREKVETTGLRASSDAGTPRVREMRVRVVTP